MIFRHLLLIAVLLVPVASNADALRGRCKSKITGTDQGFVYGATESELTQKCAKNALEPIVDEITLVHCDPTGHSCGNTAQAREGDRIAKAVQIKRSEVAEIHNPACGDKKWSKCEELCLEAPPNTTIVPTTIQLSVGHAILCVPFGDPEDQQKKYASCQVANGDCATFGGVERVTQSPTRFCATGKNWSGSWARCFRIEAQVVPVQPQRPSPSASK